MLTAPFPFYIVSKVSCTLNIVSKGSLLVHTLSVLFQVIISKSRFGQLVKDSKMKEEMEIDNQMLMKYYSTKTEMLEQRVTESWPRAHSYFSSKQGTC